MFADLCMMTACYAQLSSSQIQGVHVRQTPNTSAKHIVFSVDKPLCASPNAQTLSQGSQEAAAPIEPKLEKQGSGIKKGLQKMKSGMKEMKEKVKGQTTTKRQIKHVPAVIAGPTPVHTPSPAAHELQRGNSLKDRLKRKLSPGRRGKHLMMFLSPCCRLLKPLAVLHVCVYGKSYYPALRWI